MATKKGWLINERQNLAVDIAADVSEGQVAKLTAENTAAICGAGEVPIGVFHEDRDVSELETRTSVVRDREAVCAAAASIAVGDYLKPAANGTVTPTTTGGDVLIGKALSAQTTVGGDVIVDLALCGAQYSTT